MPQSIRDRVSQIYHDLKWVVEKNPTCTIGWPSIAILRNLLTAAKDHGVDADLCESILGTLPQMPNASMSAADAYAVAGQLMRLVKA